MVSLEMSGEDYDGIPAVADALTVDDMKALCFSKDPGLIPHAIAMIKGLSASVTTLTEANATLTTENGTLSGQVESLTAQVESLQAQVEALTPSEDTPEEETTPGEGGE